MLQREYARAPRGEIIEKTTPGERFDRVNVIGALCNGEHSAIECYRHTTDSAFFEGWFKNNLLKGLPKGYTVIMDNATFHSKKGTAENSQRESAAVISSSCRFRYL